MAKILAVCTSPKKGIQKRDVGSAQFRENWGIEGDAHAGTWHRQVSLLSHQKIEAFRARGAQVIHGDFGENLVVDGIDFAALPLGTRFTCGEVVLELTQIGKECHSHCAIHDAMGECIMPREGVFSRVLHGGTIAVGDEMTVTLPFRVAVVTISDSGAAGTRADLSGAVIADMAAAAGYPVSERILLPDERAQISETLAGLCDGDRADLILTTGGTGLSPRDWTPEATRDVLDREAPGIAEAMRAKSMEVTDRAMLSRAVAGVRKGALIVNLPGSPKAARECLGYILPTLTHGLEILKGTAHNCAR